MTVSGSRARNWWSWGALPLWLLLVGGGPNRGEQVAGWVFGEVSLRVGVGLQHLAGFTLEGLGRGRLPPETWEWERWG